MAVVSWKYLENIHRLRGGSYSLLPASSVSGSPIIATFLLKIHVLLAVLAVESLIDLQIQIRMFIMDGHTYIFKYGDALLLLITLLSHL